MSLVRPHSGRVFGPILSRHVHSVRLLVLNDPDPQITQAPKLSHGGKVSRLGVRATFGVPEFQPWGSQSDRLSLRPPYRKPCPHPRGNRPDMPSRQEELQESRARRSARSPCRPIVSLAFSVTMFVAMDHASCPVELSTLPDLEVDLSILRHWS